MFITFEGIDGSGKSTQARRAYEALRGLGYDVVLTREPGGTDIGDQIRTVLLDNLDNTAMHAHAEVLLFCASRAQLVHEFIRPALTAGRIVLCDRYADSTLAYQGYGHGLPLQALRHVIEFATGGLTPDATLYLHLGVEEGLRRRQQRMAQGADWNRLDALEMAFHRRVYEGYEALMLEDAGRWLRLDARPDEDSVHRAVMDALLMRLQAGGHAPSSA